MAQTLAIGIDLGTTYSCVGVCVNGKVEIIPHYQGNSTIPSCVAFTDTEILFGDAAKIQAQKNLQNTVFDVKRLIGRKYSDSTVQEDIKLWPFKVEASVDDKPMIVVKYKGETKKFYPEEISSMVLTKMKKSAEAYLDQEISKAVISVPAYFNTFQRQATKNAGTIAGLEVLRIINEPSAAAIVYDLNNKSENETKILIFDLGGGTLDVSLLAIEVGVIDVIATAGDTHFGGEDFDNKLVEYCCNEFLKKKEIDIRGNPRALRRLRIQCERAKRVLSSANYTTIEVDALEADEDFICTISRAKFEELCMDMFKQCIHFVEKAFKDSGFSKNEIHEVVLVGGSTRIPKVQELLKEYFNGKELNQSINPDEAVAYGAAVYASALTHQNYFDILILDIIPQSLGIETDGGTISVVIPKNTTLPTKKIASFTVTCKDQNYYQVKIFEGEGYFAHDCKKLVQFDLNGIAPDLEGKIKIKAIFDIDENGFMVFFVQDKATKISAKVDSTDIEFNLSKNEIKKLVKDAEKFEDALSAIEKAWYKDLRGCKYQFQNIVFEKLPQFYGGFSAVDQVD